MSVGGSVVYVGSANLFGATPNLYAFSVGERQAHPHVRASRRPTASGPSIVDDELFVGFGLGLVGAEPGGVRAYHLP